jgi:hypothetical protein
MISLSVHLAAIMTNTKAKKRLAPVVAEFRKGIAGHRAAGASERQIKELLGASLRLALEQIEDPRLRAWLCEEFRNAAKLTPIATIYPPSRRRH